MLLFQYKYVLQSQHSFWYCYSTVDLYQHSGTTEECTLNNFHYGNYFLTNVHICMYVCVYIYIYMYAHVEKVLKPAQCTIIYSSCMFLLSHHLIHLLNQCGFSVFCSASICKQSHLWWINLNIHPYAVVVGRMSERYIQCVHV